MGCPTTAAARTRWDGALAITEGTSQRYNRSPRVSQPREQSTVRHTRTLSTCHSLWPEHPSLSFFLELHLPQALRSDLPTASTPPQAHRIVSHVGTDDGQTCIFPGSSTKWLYDQGKTPL